MECLRKGKNQFQHKSVITGLYNLTFSIFPFFGGVGGGGGARGLWGWRLLFGP